MNERDYHDHHYAEGGGAIFDGALFARVHERAVRDFLAGTQVGRAHRVLSLGCGDGAIERRLAPHVGEIVGIDISAVAIAQAKAKSSEAGLHNATFLVSEPGTASMADLGKFDAIAAFAFLHHLEDAAIGETLVAARHALRRGGAFFSADPSRRRLVARFAWLVRRTYERTHSPDERELDPDTLVRLARDAGFSEPRVAYTDYFLGPLAWLAPGTPAGVARLLEALDNAALAIPVVKRFASSFSLLARAS